LQKVNLIQSYLWMSTTYFISGHINLTVDEFNEHYRDRIIFLRNLGHRFVVGDARGADQMARKLLKGYASVKVFHIGTTPRGAVYNFETVGGFADDESRDAAMTAASDEDLLYIRPPEIYKKMLGDKYNPMHISGTAKNWMRRHGV
jgi:hypothetical protein